MNLREALARSITRVHCEAWSNPEAYIRISYVDDAHKSIRGYLFNRVAQEKNGNKTPQSLPSTSFTYTHYVEYTGPLDKDDIK